MEVDLEAASQRKAKRALRTIVVIVLLGLITHGTSAGTGDEPHYLAITHSIAFDWDLDLSNNYGANEPLIASGQLQPENHVRPGAGGIVRPIHDVGMPLLFAPIVRILRPAAEWLVRTVPERAMQRAKLTPTVLYRQGISILMIAIAAVLSGLLFDALAGLGASPRAAFGTALVASLSPPLLIHSILYFTELLTALLCLFVFWRMVVSPPRRMWGWAATGAVTGLLMLIHARSAGLVLAFAALGGRAAWRAGLAEAREARRRNARPAAAFAGGLAALLLLRTAITYHFWGTLVTTPHAALGAPAPLENLREAGTRLGGLLLDQEFGLLVYAPIFVLAFVGLVAMPDRLTARRVIFVCACYLAPILLPLTNVQGWTGGWSPAGRFLTPIVPLLALPLPWTFGRTPRPLLALLLAVQIFIDAYMWQNPKNLWNDGDGVAAVCSRGGAGVCGYLPSFVRR